MHSRPLAVLLFAFCMCNPVLARAVPGSADAPALEGAPTPVIEPKLDEVPLAPPASKQGRQNPKQPDKSPPGPAQGDAEAKGPDQPGEETVAGETPQGKPGEPEAAKPEEVKPEEVFVPALLSVELKKQHAYACQYWIKLNNRLPHKIRNLPLRFSAYIKSPDYPDPIVYESVTRSFFEMRPTEEQYLDLFYINVGCDDILSIRVADTGQCTVGESSRFTTQTGDCGRYIVVQESPLVKMVKATATGEEPPPAPTPEAKTAQIDTEIKQEHIERLISHFILTFGKGDLEGLMGMFDQSAPHAGLDVEAIRKHYADLFKTTHSRTMGVQHLSWRPLSIRTAQITFHTWGNWEQAGFPTSTGYLEAVDMRVELRGQDLVVTRFMARRL